MSGNRNDGSTAGLIGLAVAGGALVGAACYAAYEYFNNSQSTEAPLQSNNLLEGTLNSVCLFCDANIANEESIELLCGHCFHRTCLQGNYILHMGERDGYKCRVCQEPLPQFILNQLCN